MGKKQIRKLRLLQLCCVVMIGLVLLAFAVQAMSGISVLQIIWVSLLLSQNILTLAVIPFLKQD